MIRSPATVCALMCTSMVALAAPVKVTLALKDGSRLVGTTSTSSLLVEVGTKLMKQNVSMLNSFEVTNENQIKMLTWTYVEPTRGLLESKTLDVETAFGKFKVPLAMIVHADVGEPIANGTLNPLLKLACSDVEGFNQSHTTGGSLLLLQILFKNGPVVMLTAPAKDETAKKKLDALEISLTACRKNAKTFQVENAKYFDAVDTALGGLKGWSAPMENVHLN